MDDASRSSDLSPVKRALLELREMRARLEAVEGARTEPIAVIGIGCRFPGGARDPEAFWALLRDGVDAIREVPRDRWDVDAYYDADPMAPGKMSTRWGGFVEDGVDRFDARFFGISPREAASMDPQQRVLLEVTWEALERAGQAPAALHGSRTGVFIGIGTGDYAHLQAEGGDPARIDAYRATGNSHSVASGRLSYVLGLQGPSISVDTACSSSLVAVHLACQALRAPECGLAVAGGVNLILAPLNSIALSKAGMMAPDGRCKAFDAAADGFVRAEGCGIVVLKRLSDAVADGDRILAVIRGTAINQDGRSSGLTAPNGPAQEAVIRAALASSGVEPGDVSYVEAHGTGTALGDPIEVQALGAAMGAGRAAERPLMIGSVKTNIGHLEAAAGVAGLIKVVLALEHGEIPPHLHLKQPNPYIAWPELPVTVPTRLTRWPEGRRFAGVSSFGFSGTNAHVVVEAAPVVAGGAEAAGRRRLHVLTVSGKSEEAVRTLAGRYAAHLAAHPEQALGDVCFTANAGRAHFEHRLALVADGVAQAQERLAAGAAGTAAAGVVQGRVTSAAPPEVAFLFTGQGAQYAGMGRELYETEPVFRDALDRCDAALREELGDSLVALLYGPEAAAGWLDETRYTQPALFALEWALAEMWRGWGIEPTAVLGHSVGEYVAACVAGVMSVEAGLKLIATRGRLMGALPAGGAMVAVYAAERRVRMLLERGGGRVDIAAVNGPEQVVVSGPGDAVAAVVAALEAAGIKTRRLTVSHAFHSTLMEPMLEAFGREAATVAYQPPRLAMISNVTGTVMREAPPTGYWVRHVREAVRFSEGMTALAGQGCEIYLEVGPNPVLVGLGRDCVVDGAGTWVPSLRAGRGAWEQVLESLARLYASGVAVDWAAYDRGRGRRRVALPTYPFERDRHWIAAGERAPRRTEAAGPRPDASGVEHPLLGSRLRAVVPIFESELGADAPAFLADYRVHGAPMVPATACAEAMLAAARAVLGPGGWALEGAVFGEALMLPEAGARPVQVVVSPEGDGHATCRVASLQDGAAAGGASGAWRVHATGRIRARSDAPAPRSLDALRARCPEDWSVDALHRGLAERGLAYGPSFEGIERLWRGPGEALARIRLPERLATEARACAIHPALLEACIAPLGLAACDGTNGRPADGAYLPIGLERLSLHDPPGPELWSHVVMRPRADGAGHTVTGDITVLDDGGRVVADVRGLVLGPVTRDAIGPRTRSDDWLYEIEWTPKAREGRRPSAPAPGSWVILADQGGVGLALAGLLRARGERCVLATPDAETATTDGPWVRIDPARPEDFRRLLCEALPADAPPCRGLVHLWSLDAAVSEETRPAALGAASLRGAGSVVHLLQALIGIDLPVPPALWVVTRGAQPVGPAAPSVVQAPCWGLGRVVSLEHPELWGGLVDLDPNSGPAEAAAGLLDEICQPDGEDQVALRAAERWVPRLARGTPSPAPPLRFRSDGAYLITGGLGRLGLRIARWMAEHGAGHLVLMGRTGLPERSTWARLAEGDAAREQIQMVQAIEVLGATVSVARGDVSDPAGMAATFARFGDAWPALRGVVHAAGALRSCALGAMDAAALEGVFRSKVLGGWLLHQLTRGLDLDLFVLFSSAASVWGSRDLAHYAAANHFLDALAHHRRALRLPALSVNWGWWGGGRTSRDTEQFFDRIGLEAMPPDRALEQLGALLGAGRVQHTVAAVDWAVFKPIYEARRARPFLAGIEARRPAAGAGPGRAAPDLLRLIEAAPGPQRRDVLRDHVRGEVAAILGFDRSRPLPVDQGFFDLGMDSMMAVELRRRLEAAVGCALPPTLAMEYPTIEALVGHLATDVLAVDDGPAAPHPQPPGSPPIAVAAGREALSEDELTARLAETLRQRRAGAP